MNKAIINTFTVMTLVALVSLAPTILAQAENQATTEVNLPSFLNDALKNPKVMLAVAIQFFMGLGLGYYSAKVIRYILALIGILILGSILSIWSLGGSAYDIISRLGEEATKIYPMVQSVLSALGILTIGPIAAGFILGAIIALRK